MIHLDCLPGKSQRKHILLSPVRRHSAQLCSVRWEAFAGGFWGDVCDMKVIRSGSLPSSFSFLSSQPRENWTCPHWGLTLIWNLLASFILVTVPEFTFKSGDPKKATSLVTRWWEPPYCLHHSHPCLAYGTLCFLAKTASTFRHSLCQMNSFANSRNTCRRPSWPAV